MTITRITNCVVLQKVGMYLIWMHIKTGLTSFMTSGRYQVKCYLRARIKKKNAGEVSITILAEVVSWYYPETEALTIYSQDGDTYEFQRKAEASLRELFTLGTPVPVSYKSNDAILCQPFRDWEISN